MSESNINALTLVLELIDQARRMGTIPQSILEYQTFEQSWEAYRSSPRGVSISWANRIFSAEEEFNLALIPSLGEKPLTYGTGWLWCLSDADIQKRELSTELAEFLSAPDFLTQWAPLSGYLPVRPSSISGYADAELQSILTALLTSARVRPDRNSIAEFAQQVNTAAASVINGSAAPEESLEIVFSRMEGSEAQ